MANPDSPKTGRPFGSAAPKVDSRGSARILDSGPGLRSCYRRLGTLDDLDLVVDGSDAVHFARDLSSAVALGRGGGSTPQAHAAFLGGDVDGGSLHLAVVLERALHALRELLVRVGLRRLGLH